MTIPIFDVDTPHDRIHAVLHMTSNTSIMEKITNEKIYIRLRGVEVQEIRENIIKVKLLDCNEILLLQYIEKWTKEQLQDTVLQNKLIDHHALQNFISCTTNARLSILASEDQTRDLEITDKIKEIYLTFGSRSVYIYDDLRMGLSYQLAGIIIEESK